MDIEQARASLDGELHRLGLDVLIYAETLNFFDGAENYLEVLFDPSSATTKDNFHQQFKLIPRVWHGFMVAVVFSKNIAYGDRD